MNNFNQKYVISLLVNKSDLLAYSKSVNYANYMEFYMDAQEDLGKIIKTLEDLPDEHRERIEVYLFSGLKQQDMAEKLNTKQPNIKRNFLRSINKLVKKLND